MQNQELINTLIALDIFGRFPSDYEFNEDILYLDNSVNIEDLETATAFGHANKQIAIWDVVNRKTIYLNK